MAPTRGGPVGPRESPTSGPRQGSGTLTFSGKGTFGTVKGTVTTKVVPSSITPGEPCAGSRWRSAGRRRGSRPQCAPGTQPGTDAPHDAVPARDHQAGTRRRIGDASHPFDAVGDVTVVWGDGVLTCGATDTFRQTDSYDARVSGSLSEELHPVVRRALTRAPARTSSATSARTRPTRARSRRSASAGPTVREAAAPGTPAQTLDRHVPPPPDR